MSSDNVIEILEKIASDENWTPKRYPYEYNPLWIGGKPTPKELALKALDEYKRMEFRLDLFESAFSRMQGIFPFDLYEICPELREDEEDDDE